MSTKLWTCTNSWKKNFNQYLFSLIIILFILVGGEYQLFSAVVKVCRWALHYLDIVVTPCEHQSLYVLILFPIFVSRNPILHKIGFCNARCLEKLLGCPCADSMKTPKFFLYQLPLVWADDGIKSLACAFLENARGLPHVYDGIAQVEWGNLSLFLCYDIKVGRCWGKGRPTLYAKCQTGGTKRSCAESPFEGVWGPCSMDNFEFSMQVYAMWSI